MKDDHYWVETTSPTRGVTKTKWVFCIPKLNKYSRGPPTGRPRIASHASTSKVEALEASHLMLPPYNGSVRVLPFSESWHTELFSGPDWATFSQLNSWRDKKGTLWPIQKALFASLAGPCVGYLQDPFGVEAYEAIWGRLVGGHLSYWFYLSFAIFLIPIV